MAGRKNNPAPEPDPQGGNPDSGSGSERDPRAGGIPNGGTLGGAGTLAEWLTNGGEACDVVLSSRVRLARNLAGHLFVHRAAKDERERVLQTCRDWILGANVCDRIMWVDLHESPQLDRNLLVERHLISKQHAKGKPAGSGGAVSPAADEPRAVAISIPDERLSIMVNEEDHLRIQMMHAGLSLEECWKHVSAIDDKLEAGLDYAFSPKLGYLTACPTNVGTGMRMSVMLHLPALKVTGEIEKVKRAATDMNLAVRGFYGEGSDAIGDLYQISNQTTLGKPEGAVLTELQDSIIPEVIQYERHARNTLLSKRRAALDDQVFRALGALTHARLIAADEAMQLLSLVRLGVVLGIIPNLSVQAVNTLFLLVQPAHLQRVLGKEMDQEHRRIGRAAMIRERLTK
ncbi:MAG: protein arginine kinase [Phycisphaerae bacterium]|nr:protein arginine kinase [Phycisphaerae bacterium]MBN8598381.1 protein arginine kinase [Planctomycetota bacterium]